MDPNATWRELLAAYAEGKRDDCFEACSHLIGLLAKGGFPPCLTGNETIDRLTVQMFCTAYLLHRELVSCSKGESHADQTAAAGHE
jgi:hypothetical protein